MDNKFQIVVIKSKSLNKAVADITHTKWEESMIGEYPDKETAIKEAEDLRRKMTPDEMEMSLILIREIYRDERLQNGSHAFEYDIVWTSKYMDFRHEYGWIKWGEEELALMEEPYWKYVGEDLCFTAAAEGMDGEFYQATWDVDWKAWEESDRKAEWTCDRDNVLSVEKMKFR